MSTFEEWWAMRPFDGDVKAYARDAWFAAARAYNTFDEWNAALETAATIAMDMPLASTAERHDYRWSDTYKAAALEIADAIRAEKRPNAAVDIGSKEK